MLDLNGYGEIMNGFMMSTAQHPVWPQVWALVVKMISSYPDRWQTGAASGAVNVMDNTLTYFSTPVAMSGQEGVLCMGPLAMTKVVYKYLRAQDALDTCVPKSFMHFWKWNSLRTRVLTHRLFSL